MLRDMLPDMLPDGAAERFLVGRTAEGRGSVVGAILAECDAEINSTVLTSAGLIYLEEAPRKNVRAWMLTRYPRNGALQTQRSRSAERPGGAEARRHRYICLKGLHNRPGGYFVCRPGPPPAKGQFVSTRRIFEFCAAQRLPKAAPPPEPAPDEPVLPRETLPAGLELDAYGDTARSPPCSTRGNWSRSPPPPPATTDARYPS